jgi:hypothetical protein
MSRKKAQYTFLHANKKVHHDFLWDDEWTEGIER